MSAMTDFSSLMADVRACQQELVAMHQKMMRPDEKQMMGKLIEEIENARQQAETIVPQTLQEIQESAKRSAAQAKQQQQTIEQRKKELQAQMAAPAAQKPPVEKPESKIRIDPNLGPTLRMELLERFGQRRDSEPLPMSIKEAWQDWQ